jgi:cysteine desulfurase / selenocysteine lyase
MSTSFDFSDIRREFPITERMLYFDTAHQAPLAVSIKRALDAYFNESLETAGPKSKWLAKVEEVRGRVARLLNANETEIAFTKNTSEGLNIAANALPLQAGDNVLLIEGDHPNNAYAFLNLRAKGVDIRFAPMTGETIGFAGLAPYIDARTRAISLSHVTFHAGHVADIAAIGRHCAQRGIHLVVDAMQSVGVLPIDTASMDVSMMAFGCHKGLLVPQGLGILYANRSLPDLSPAYLSLSSLSRPPGDLVARGDNMDLKAGAGRFEIGNYNLADIHALGAALDLIERTGVPNIMSHVLGLGDRLLAHLAELGVGVAGPRAREYRSHIIVLDLPVPEWMAYFKDEGVRVSPERGGLRVSLALFNSAEDVDRLAAIIRKKRATATDLQRPRHS